MLMAHTVYNISGKIGRVQSDIKYVEESLKEGIVPKGFAIKWTPQGLDRDSSQVLWTFQKENKEKVARKKEKPKRNNFTGIEAIKMKKTKK